MVAATAERDDALLVDLARTGDELAWTTLVRRYQEAAFRLAYLKLGDASDAEDVTQDAFIRAYHSLNKFDTARPFKPWLLQIVVNLTRNRQRSLSRYWVAIQRWRNQQPVADNKPLADKLEAAQLWQAVQTLSPKLQEVVYLRYFLDLSVAESAETLGIQSGTVKSRTSRALRQLRGLIEAEL